MGRRLALVIVLLLLGPRPGFAAECRPLVDFSRYTVGEFPDDWKPKEDTAREIYKVLEQGGVRFIRGTAQGTGVQIGREFPWDLRELPVLAWKWRPQLFPTGADERESNRNDSALGVYAVFPHSPVSVKTVKYVWSATAPAGTTATASRSLTKMLVLRSGKPEGTGWVEESADVARDYRRLFGDVPKQPRGIALLTDADDTKSAAVGDYTDFRLCPAPEQPSAPKAVKPPTTKPAARPARPAASRVEERTPPVDRPTVVTAVRAVAPPAPQSPLPAFEAGAR